MIDPNNHVPEVMPNDGWDDFEAGHFEPVSSLPPKRQLLASSPSETAEPALYIASEIGTRDSASEKPASRLQITEITGDVIRLNANPSKPERPVAFQERPVLPKHHKGQPEVDGRWGAGPAHSKRWMAWMGIAVTSCTVIGLAILPWLNDGSASLSHEVVWKPEEVTHVDGAELLKEMTGQQANALSVFRSYLNAQQAGDFLSLVRDGDALRDQIATAWRPQQVKPGWEPHPEWTVLSMDGRPCGMLSGSLPDGIPFRAYFTEQNGHLLLDWKATTAFGTAYFAELEQGSGDGSEIRGTISVANAYSAAFPEQSYQSYRLISPDGQRAIWCFAPRASTTESAIAPLAGGGDIIHERADDAKITLRLQRGPANSRPNEWLVAEMLHNDWVTP